MAQTRCFNDLVANAMKAAAVWFQSFVGISMRSIRSMAIYIRLSQFSLSLSSSSSVIPLLKLQYFRLNPVTMDWNGEECGAGGGNPHEEEVAKDRDDDEDGNEVIPAYTGSWFCLWNRIGDTYWEDEYVSMKETLSSSYSISILLYDQTGRQTHQVKM